MKQDEFESLSIFEQATITPAYQLGFQAGAASRDAYIEQLELALLQVRKAICGDIHNTDDLLDLIASRDAEIQRLQFALADSEALELGTAEHCDQLRAELVAALAACKLKDEALLTCQTGDYSTGHVIHPSFDERLVERAIAIQPDDSALKTWLGEPLGEMHKAHARSLDEKPWCKEILLYSAGSPFDLPEYRVTVYSPKGLK